MSPTSTIYTMGTLPRAFQPHEKDDGMSQAGNLRSHLAGKKFGSDS